MPKLTIVTAKASERALIITLGSAHELLSCFAHSPSGGGRHTECACYFSCDTY